MKLSIFNNTPIIVLGILHLRRSWTQNVQTAYHEDLRKGMLKILKKIFVLHIDPIARVWVLSNKVEETPFQ